MRILPVSWGNTSLRHTFIGTVLSGGLGGLTPSAEGHVRVGAAMFFSVKEFSQKLRK